MTANHWHIHFLRGLIAGLSDEGVCSDNIQRSDTKELSWIVAPFPLQYLSSY